MVEQAARTFICSIVFVDLVEFSRKSNAEQVLVKETCNALAAEALESIEPDARIVIDTGDGFAITFLGDPEDALLVGLKLRDGIEEAMSTHSVGVGRGTANGHVRIGINLGPVKLGTNFTGHVNIVGDGINVAERIMGFALPGQMLVSRSFHDMVSRLAEEYGKLLTFDGTRTDNNSRVHALYVAGKGDAALRVAEARAAKRHASATTTTRIISPMAVEAGNTAAAGMRPFTADSPPPHLASSPAAANAPGGTGYSWLHDRFKVGFAALLLLVAAGFQSSLLMQKWRGNTSNPATSGVATAAAPSAGAVESPAKVDAPPISPPASAPAPATARAPVIAPPAAVPANTAANSPAASTKALPKTATTPQTEHVIMPVEPPAKAVSRPAILPTPTAANVIEQPRTAPATTNRPGNSERKPESAREERSPPKRPAAPQGIQIPAPSISAPTAAGAKSPAAATPPVATTAQPVVPERAREPPQPAANSAVVKRSGVIPDFPREATREGFTRGSVRVKLLIDSAGNVKNIEILESRPSRVFDRAVRRTLTDWKYNAGADNRVHVFDIEFKQDN